jgi:hypothetical protein
MGNLGIRLFPLFLKADTTPQERDDTADLAFNNFGSKSSPNPSPNVESKK